MKATWRKEKSNIRGTNKLCWLGTNQQRKGKAKKNQGNARQLWLQKCKIVTALICSKENITQDT